MTNPNVNVKKVATAALGGALAGGAITAARKKANQRKAMLKVAGKAAREGVTEAAQQAVGSRVPRMSMRKFLTDKATGIKTEVDPKTNKPLKQKKMDERQKDN